jgi:hypothetical protein
VRPDPPRYDGQGFHYEAFEETRGWTCPPIGAGRCRWMTGRRACQRPAVATLMRGLKPRAWDYCEDHLYGRWIEAGKVMSWRLVKD